jgi:hypothetical protein
MPSGPLSLSKERVRERSSEDFNDSLKVPVAQQNSKRPLAARDARGDLSWDKER